MGDQLDSLFATPPAGFIAERKRIVAALKAAGRKEDAKAVEKIPRPSLAVWTVNRVAQLDPQLVRRLGAITDRLQGTAIAEYAAVAAEHRQALADLRRRAAEVLGAAGQTAGLHLVQRVVANVRAAASGPETRAALERGRLERDLDEQQDAAAGLFGAMAAMASGAPVARGKVAPAKESKPTAAPGAKAAKQVAAEAKAQERAREKQIAATEREVERLRKADAAARKQVQTSERAVAAARADLATAERTLAREREAAAAAAQELAQAETALARL